MKRFTLIFALFALLLAACGGVGTPAIEAPAGESAEVGAPSGGGAASGSGLCAHQFYPVVVGSTHTYTSTSADVGTFTFTDTVTDVRADGFTLSSDFDGLTRTQEWECTADGLVTLQYTGGPSAAIQTSGMNGEFQTTNVVGVSLPASVAPGDSWSQSFDITGNINMAEGMSATAAGSATYNFAAIGMEQVTTNAGTFNALRIEGSLVLTMEVNMEGLTIPFDMTSNSISWYAEGVGWVRTEDTATLAEGGSFIYTVELDSYMIP